VALTAFLALLAAPGAAASQGVEQAEALFRDARLDEALADFERLSHEGGTDRGVLARIALHLGILRVGTGDLERARLEFLRLLVVQPHADLPVGLGPAVEAQFGEARRTAGEHPLTAWVEVVRAGSAVIVRGGARGTAARLVRTAHFEAGDALDRAFEGSGPHEVRLELGAVARARVSLLDQDGWVLRVAEAPIESPSPTLAPVAATSRGAPLVSRWWLWAGVAAVVVGGVVVGLAVAGSPDGAQVGAPAVVGGQP
jgi:hypothetical protein